MTAKLSPQEMLALAESLERDKPHEALPLFRQIASQVGDHPALLDRIASVLATLGHRSDAMDMYRRAISLAPQQRSSIVGLARLLSETDFDEAIRLLGNVPSSGTADDMETLSVRVRLREWSARAKLSLPIHHVLDLKDWPFRYAIDARDEFDTVTAETIRKEPADYRLQINRIEAHLAMGRLEDANAMLAAFSETRTSIPYSKLRFGHVPESGAILPAVKDIKPLKAKEALFLSCDPYYAKLFVLPLLKSIASVSPGLGVHIHMVGNDPGTVKVLQRVNLDVSVSTEDPASYIAATKIQPQHYFGAIRMIRFAELIERTGATLCMMDVDALAKNDCRQLFKISGDLAMRVRVGRLEIYNQFSACMIKATPAALPYLRAVSRIMADSMNNLWWGVDQFALLSAYIAIKPDLSLIGPRVADIGDYARESVIWFTAGTAKRGLVLGWPSSDQEPARLRYAKTFKALS